jgi:hypothetical protein
MPMIQVELNQAQAPVAVAPRVLARPTDGTRTSRRWDTPEGQRRASQPSAARKLW